MLSNSDKLGKGTPCEIQQSYATFINSLDDGFELLELVRDKEGNTVDFTFLFVNPAYERQTGLKAINIVGKRKKEAAPAAEKRWYDYAIQAAKTGKTLSYQYYNPKVNGYYDTQFIPIPPNQIAVLFKDITERMKAEESLTESEELYRTLFENTEDGFQATQLIYDEQGNPVDLRYLKVNDAFIKQTGIKQTIIEGKTAKELFPNLELYWLETYDNVLNTGKPTHFENYNKDTKRWYDAYLFPYTKNIVGGLFRDITERKKAEEALEQSKERLQNIINAMDDGIVLIGLDGKVIDCNQATLKQFKVKREEVIGKVIMDYMYSENKENFIRETQDLLRKTGKAIVETQLLRKNESPLSVEVSLTRFYDKNNKPIGLLGVARDITMRKKLQQELENYTKDLEKIVEERSKQLQEKERLAAIGQTAGMVGHDVRNPLQAMTGDLYLIKEELKAADTNKQVIAESIGSIEQNIDYVNKIVSDLQDYTRPIAPKRREENAKALIDEAVKAIKVPQTIQTHVVAEPELTINTDKDYLRRILSNLILNAIQAMPSGGILEIQAVKGKEEVTITVEDTGIGIPVDIMEKLFTPLFTTKAKGQGLGLAVVKRLVEGLNGSIKVESEKGKGTKFIIEIPD